MVLFVGRVGDLFFFGNDIRQYFVFIVVLIAFWHIIIGLPCADLEHVVIVRRNPHFLLLVLLAAGLI